MVTVKLRSPLRELAEGRSELDVDGGTVGEVLHSLERAVKVRCHCRSISVVGVDELDYLPDRKPRAAHERLASDGRITVLHTWKL